MPEQSDYRVAVFGSGGVGKSSIVQRFCKGTFSDAYVPTVEDTYRQVISCNNQKGVCTLHITDSTGSHQFPAMQRLSINRGNAFIMIYAVDKADSFSDVDAIYQEIRAIKGNEIDDTPLMLVGNKIDEPDCMRQVKTAVGRAKADRWGVGFIETSAKHNANVTELFQQLLALEKRRNLSLDLDEGKKKKKGERKQQPPRNSSKQAAKAEQQSATKSTNSSGPSSASAKADGSQPADNHKKCTVM